MLYDNNLLIKPLLFTSYMSKFAKSVGWCNRKITHTGDHELDFENVKKFKTGYL